MMAAGNPNVSGLKYTLDFDGWLEKKKSDNIFTVVVLLVLIDRVQIDWLL